MSQTGHGKSTTKEPSGSHWQFTSDSDVRKCSGCNTETFVSFDRNKVKLCVQCVDDLVNYVES